MKKVIGKVKLAPYVPAWYDAKNDIHLMRSKYCIEKEVYEGVDMRPINKGVKAGYIIFTEVKPEQIKEEIKPEPVREVEPVSEEVKEAPKKKRKTTPKKKEEVKIDVEVKTEGGEE